MSSQDRSSRPVANNSYQSRRGNDDLEAAGDHEGTRLLRSATPSGSARRRVSNLSQKFAKYKRENPRRVRVASIVSAVALLVLLGGLITFIYIWRSGEYDIITGLVVGTKGAVASEDETCSNLGVEVLRDNGTAVDAAIAAGLCIGAINSFSSGIGGGGFMTVRRPDGTADFIDFREKAPAAASEDMFVNNPIAAQVGGLAVGVPGELRGYELAHKRHGRLSWARLIQPSIDLCEKGFKVSSELYSRMKLSEDFLKSSPGFREVYTTLDPKTHLRELIPKGGTVYRPNLAKTLRRVRDSGASVFYEGPIARSIVETIARNGGNMTETDLSDYSPAVRKPLIGYYRGRKIITAPPPASGAVLLQILNILEGFDVAHTDPSLNVVRSVEACKWGFAARTELGDTDYLNITRRLEEMMDKGHAADLRGRMSDFETYPVEYYHPKYDVMETPGTTHISAADEQNMAVAVTSTVNLLFGAKLMDQEWGIILNNQMDDFSSPNVTNAFGLPPSKHNFIRPGKRPLSSSVPTIVERDGRFEASFGASGGSKIITAVAQSIINVFDYGMNAYDAVAAPRFHHQLVPELVSLDYETPKNEVDALIKVGHNVTVNPEGYKASEVQVVMRMKDGSINAASDPRKNGKAAAY